MSTTATILDYLDEDCLLHVLDFIPVRRMFSLERTCRRWQEIVLKYLSRLRFGIKPFGQEAATGPLPKIDVWLSLWTFKNWSFKRWTKKLGASVVVAYCTTMGQVKIVGEFCPKLEAVMFVGINAAVLLNFPYENYKQLRYLGFFYCDELSDYTVQQYIESNVLETIEISAPLSRLTGQCLLSIKSGNVKTLILRCCLQFNYWYLFKAADLLTGLRKLVLEFLNYDYLFINNREAYDYLIPFLERTPCLEHLFLRKLGEYLNPGLRIFDPLCRLRNLRYLSLESPVTDANLEAVSRCPELTFLFLENCSSVSRRGLAALCRRAGARLTELALHDSELLTNDDVVACIAACPKLTKLDVSRCQLLTRDMLPRAAAARRDLRASCQLVIAVCRRNFRLHSYSEDLGVIKIEECGCKNC